MSEYIIGFIAGLLYMVGLAFVDYLDEQRRAKK